MDSGVIEGGLNVTLTIRLLMHGKVRFSLYLFIKLCIWKVEKGLGFNGMNKTVGKVMR